jgi:hypothetical protein
MYLIKGAGILLLENYHGKPYITLFGKKGGLYEDLGGRSDPGESSEETAYREAREESCNLIQITPLYLAKHGKFVIHKQYKCFIMYVSNLSYRDYMKNAYQVHTLCKHNTWKETNDMTRIPLKNILEMLNTNIVIDIFGKHIRIRDRTIKMLELGRPLIINLLSKINHRMAKNITLKSRMKCLIGTTNYSLQTNSIINRNLIPLYAIYIIPDMNILNYNNIKILVAGFHPNNYKMNMLRNISNSGSVNWKINRKKIWLYGNMLNIRSRTLLKISDYMRSNGFGLVESDFNIQLNNINLIDNIISSNLNWKIILVEQINGIQRIVEYYPLKTN